jgi:hypothetical protein
MAQVAEQLNRFLRRLSYVFLGVGLGAAAFDNCTFTGEKERKKYLS